jgi:uncharacterized BrkB/YihY/UPF0761 family membrane protein
MKTNKIAYWITTGLISAMMLMSGIMYFVAPEVKEGMAHFGFPDFFRIELGAAKIIAAIALILPMVPARVKEWAYAGLGIVLISALFTHFQVGDSADKFGGPIFAFILLAASYITRMRMTSSK